MTSLPATRYYGKCKAMAKKILCTSKDSIRTTILPVVITGLLLLTHFYALSQCSLFRTVNAGEGSSFGIRLDGSLWAWGQNNHGELGDGTKINRFSPVRVLPGTTWKAVSAGFRHTVAIKSDGTLWAWGFNNLGQVDGTGGEVLTPKQVGNASDWSIISAGSDYTLAIKTDGSLWAWGYNGLAGLGDGTIDPKPTPQRVGTDTWKMVSAGTHCLGVKTNGTLWAWGPNYAGQLGVGGTDPKLVPTQVGAAANWQTVSSGDEFSVALTTDSKLYTWGSAEYGKLGDGIPDTEEEYRETPAQIGTESWKAVSAGDDHVLAIKADGTLWAWGNHRQGQLGRGYATSGEALTPVVVNTSTDWDLVEAGDWYSLAVKTSSLLWGTGWNREGQLGNGGITESWAMFLHQFGQVGSNNMLGIAGANVSSTRAITPLQSITVIDDCSLLAAIESNGTHPLSGNTAIKVWIENTQPQRYIRRHYEITPDNNASEATGRITLYFTQEDFRSFNIIAEAGDRVYMPRWDTDNENRANILIEKRGGTSSDGSGLPHTYPGPVVTINPDDNDIIWNSATSMWEISFDVDGFSGFFVKTGSASLPVNFGAISASIKNNLLSVNWQTLNEKSNDHFLIEISADGKHFTEIGRVQTHAKNGDSDEPIHYRFEINTGAVTALSLAGLGLLGMLLPLGRKHKKLLLLGVVVCSVHFFACHKQQDDISFYNDQQLYIRIAQVDKDGTKMYSKVIAAERK